MMVSVISSLRRYSSLLLVTCLFAIGSLGCAPKPESTEVEPIRDLNHIQRAYGIMVSGHNRPPRDMAEVRKILDELHVGDLNPQADEVLVSSRDGEPYVIIMNANLGMADGRDEILAYEKTGVEGNRYVLLMSRDVRQISDDEFRRAKFAKGHRPGTTLVAAP
jgi:hypothetical protein